MVCLVWLAEALGTENGVESNLDQIQSQQLSNQSGT
jgi:hypothetical protein